MTLLHDLGNTEKKDYIHSSSIYIQLVRENMTSCKKSFKLLDQYLNINQKRSTFPFTFIYYCKTLRSLNLCIRVTKHSGQYLRVVK